MSVDMSNKMLESLAQQINAVELDSAFTLTVFDAGVARLSFPDGMYAPDVYHSEENDVEIFDDGWEALTGFTGQDGYNGAVNHASEFVGREIARELVRLAEDEPQTYVMVTVEVASEVEGRDAIPAGWAILRKLRDTSTEYGYPAGTVMT